MDGYKTIFKKEVENYLFPFFWQHGEDHKVLEEYVDKIYESGMKALCVEARPHPDFVGNQWWSDMDCILKKVKEKDMKMWILDDSHFPTGYANGKIVKDYPQYLKSYLYVRRFDVQGPMKQVRIDLRITRGRSFTGKVTQRFNVLGVYIAKRTTQSTEDFDSIDPTTLVDITSQMRMSDRLLTLDVPEGAYSIFTVFETDKGNEEATKDYLNPLIKEATQVLIDEVYEPHYQHYKDEFGKTILGFFSDEPRFGNDKGPECPIGKDMPLPWRDGLEKELGFEMKYLPLLWYVGNGKEGEIRFQYMDLITKLYNENFTEVLASWCEKHGVWYLGHTIEDNGAHARLGYGTGHFFRGQQGMHVSGIDVIGGQIVPGMNYHHDAFSTGGSNGEFYHYALAKLGSSAAHLDPKKEGRLMCEAFGAYGWNEGLRMMKWIADSLMVRGVNFIVPHAFDPKDFPDWDCPPHFYAHGHNPQFRMFSTLDNYMNRVMSIFRDGHYPAKVGVFYPAEMEWAGNYMPIEKVCRALTEKQISFDIVSRDYLLQASISNNVYTINKTRFECLIIPYGMSMPNDMIGVLNEMVENNIQVIFIDAYPTKVLGYYQDIQWDKVKEHSTVHSLSELELKEYQSISLSSVEKDLVMSEYVREDKHIYMFFNENMGKEIHTTIQFKEEGNIYRYDAFEDALYEFDGSLKLSPYQSSIYVICDETLPAKKEKKIAYHSVELPKNWTVKFVDSMHYPNFNEVIDCSSLACVQNIPGYEAKSGTVQYSAKIHLEKKETVLDLGKVHESVQVFMNDQLVDTKICYPYTFDLTDFICEGENEIKIEVTNTLGTKQRDYLSHFLMIEPFGIEGDVSLAQGE